MIFDRLLPLLNSASIKKEPIEVLELNFSSTMDFIIAFIFGLQNCSDFLLDTESRKRWLDVYSSRRPYRFWAGEAKGFHNFFRKLGIYIVPKLVDEATSELEDWTLEKCKAAQKALKDPPSRSPSQQTYPVVYAQLANAFPPNPSLKGDQPDLRIATELLDHLAAGHETSGITLTYLMHELCLHPDLQRQLREECLTLNPPLIYPPKNGNKNAELPSSKEFDALPLLHAVLMETLRIHAAIPGPRTYLSTFLSTLSTHPFNRKKYASTSHSHPSTLPQTPPPNPSLTPAPPRTTHHPPNRHHPRRLPHPPRRPRQLPSLHPPPQRLHLPLPRTLGSHPLAPLPLHVHHLSRGGKSRPHALVLGLRLRRPHVHRQPLRDAGDETDRRGYIYEFSERGCG